MTTTAARIRPADVRGNAGLVEARVRRETGRTVSVYEAAAQGLDPEGTPYYTVCEDHGYGIGHATLTIARWMAPSPRTWCGPCIEES